MKPFPRPRSVFAKLFVILVASGLFTQLIVIAGFVFLNQPQVPDNFIFTNVQKYLNYMAREIARNPTAENAKRILNGTGFDVRISGPIQFETDESLQKIPERLLTQIPPERHQESSERGPRMDRNGPPDFAPSDFNRQGGPPEFASEFGGPPEKRNSGPFGDGPPNMKGKKGPGRIAPTFVNSRPYFQIRHPSQEGMITIHFLGPQGPPSASRVLHVVLLIVVTIIVISVGAIATYRVLKPVGTLSNALRIMGKGDLTVSVPVQGKDELSNLSRAFNYMASRIRFLMADKQQMLLEISHEFRAPLARVNAACSLMEEGELQNNILRDVVELDSLIQALVIAGKMEAGKAQEEITEVSLVEVLQDAIARFPDTMHRIQCEVPDEPFLMRGSKRTLTTLIKNLIGNGLKYSPSDKEVYVSLHQLPDIIEVRVSDKGIGISPEQLKKVFEPFYRADNKKTPGFGLGLGLCQRIVQAHGGRLQLISSPGEGTTAIAQLPTGTRSLLPNPMQEALSG